MPVVPVKRPQRFPDEVTRFNQRTIDRLTGGDPLDQPETPDTTDPSFGQVWRARVGTTLLQSVANEVSRESMDAPPEPDFNPFRLIAETPSLANDPRVQALVERGQFDHSRTKTEFYFDMQKGLSFFDDVQTLRRSSTGQAAASMLGVMIGDPTNYIPVGFGLSAIKEGGALARAAKFAAIGAGANLAFEKAQNALEPASNEPGPLNELIAAASGGAFAGGIGLLTSPAVRGVADGFLATRKIKQIRGDFRRMLTEPVVTAVDQSKIGTDADFAKVTLGTEIGNGARFLRSISDEAPVDNRVVSVLHRKGDEADGLLESIRAKYDEAGKTLREVPHPDQWFYDLTESVRGILDHPSLSADATPADLEAGFVDSALSQITSRYANFQAQVTPGGRIAQSVIGRLTDVYRTLSGSAQTITRASALDPLHFESGAAAENIKGVLEAAKDSTVLSIREAYRSARRGGATEITYNGERIGTRFDFGRFRRAVADYIRRQSAAEHGFDVTIPEDVHPSIIEAAKRVRGYFEQMANEAVRVGLLEVKPEGWYLPRVYDIPRILANRRAFEEALVRSFRRSDAAVNGHLVSDAHRPLVADVVESMGGRDRIGLANTEGGLAPDVRAEYRARLDEFYREGARKAFDTLTHPKERHGIADAIAPEQPFSGRALTVDESDLADFLEHDLDVILERYSRVVGGRVAVRRSIQLNPEIWGGVTLKDGSPVRSGPDLVQYLNETVDALERFGQVADERAGRKAGGRGSLVPFVRRLRSRVNRDIAMPLDVLEGRNPLGEDTGAFAAFGYFGRQLGRLSFVNKLGSVFWAQLNDLAPVTLHFLQRPRTVSMVPRAILGLKGLPVRDLQVLGLMFDQIARARAISDTDYLSTGLGFGEGVVRRASASVERGMQNAADIHSRVSLMNWITDVNRRVAGGLTIDRLNQWSKGALASDAAKASRESRFRLAWVNKMGLNRERAEQWHRLVYEHGLTTKDQPIRETMSWEEYLRDRKFVKPNFEAWPLDDPKVRDLFDTVAANLHGEVNRSLVVKPGQFDRPIINHTVLGRLFNQFQTFGMAFVNQRLRVMAQMPARYQLWYLMSYQFLGAVSDAIANQLSGRRSFEETAQLWRDNPLGMSYAAWDRSGLSGWIGRPLSVADALGIPFSPGNLLDNTVASTANRHIATGKPLTFLGPAAADVDSAARLAAKVASGQFDREAGYMAWRLAPFQNLMWLRLLHQTTGLPVTPESLIEDRLGDKPARP